MLYIVSGDRFEARNYSKDFVDACRKKRPKAEYIYFSPQIKPLSLEELLTGQGLFEKKYIVFCDEILRDKCSTHFEENKKEYITSDNMFVFFEPELSEADLKKNKDLGAKVKFFSKQAKPDATKEIFSFAELFFTGTSKNKFVSLNKLLEKKESATSILNIVLWQLRMLNITSGSTSAKESGINSFVYQKTKKMLEKIDNPFSIFIFVESVIREGRLQGENDEQILEYLVLSKF